jgi:hypothetical protein
MAAMLTGTTGWAVIVLCVSADGGRRGIRCRNWPAGVRGNRRDLPAGVLHTWPGTGIRGGLHLHSPCVSAD